MDPITPDERFTRWHTDDLRGLYRLRLRRLLIFETSRASWMLQVRQWTLVQQGARLLRGRGVEVTAGVWS